MKHSYILKLYILCVAIYTTIYSLASLNQSWALALFTVKKVLFDTKPQVPCSKNSIVLGKVYYNNLLLVNND